MDYKNFLSGHQEDTFWFKAKHDLIRILAEKSLGDRRSLKILDIGAGTGDDLEVLNMFGDVYALDQDPNAISLIDAEQCIEKKVASACAIPYADNFFDMVVSFDVFEHIENDHLAVDEIYRVLNVKGALIFIVPAFQWLFSGHDRALYHHRRYTKKTIKILLSRFQRAKISYWNSILFLPIAIRRIVEKKISQPKIDQMNVVSWLDSLFYGFLSLDNYFIENNIPVPMGLSIVGFCYK